MSETKPITTPNYLKWLLIIFPAILLIAFFIPWISWDKVAISGADMPSGKFFISSEENLGISNPFPEFSSLLLIQWANPVFAAIALLLAVLNKKARFVGVLAGLLALSLSTVYILFSKDFSPKYQLQPGIYATILAGAGIILAYARTWFRKIIWIVVAPAITYISYYEVSKYFQNQKFDNTANTSAAFTVNALDLISEFHANDSLANAKYREQILTVNGNISSLETPSDSTVNVKFADSTGSYAIFTFHEQDLDAAKKLKAGDKVSIKGSCSGGVLSEILGIESISFKRCTLNK